MRTTSQPNRQRGATVVEFAFCAMVFFVLMFAMFDLARAIYVWNAMAQATRHVARLAAVTDFTDASALQQVRLSGVFDNAGGLPLHSAITQAHFQVSYLRDDALTPADPLPACPAENIANCTSDPSGASCIRFVRVRLCVPGSDCDNVHYEPLLPLNGLFGKGGIGMPTFEAVTPAGSLGYTPEVGVTCG